MSLDVLQGAAIMLALCWLLCVSARLWGGKPFLSRMSTGLFSGAICAVGMMTPVVFVPGVLLDTRAAVVGMATLFGGPVAGGIAALIAMAFRWWLGGAGAAIGIYGLLLSWVFGLVFRFAVAKGVAKRRAREFYLFGMLIHGAGFLLYAALRPSGAPVTWEIALMFLGILPAVTVFLGLLLNDIRQRTVVVVALQQSESRLRAIAAAVPDMLLVIDEDGRYVDVISPHRVQMPGKLSGAADWSGQLVTQVLTPDDAALFLGLVHRALRSNSSQSLEYTVQGDECVQTFEICANRLESLIAGRRAAVLVTRDITLRRNAEEQIRTLALYDPLTGLPNRSFLLARLPLARRESMRSRRFAAVLSIDLDDFGRLNEAYGNAAGDRMLERAAQSLQKILPPGATLARWGGDEFVLLLEGLSANEEHAAAQAARLAHMAVQAIGLTSVDDVLSHGASASVGIALFLDESDNPVRRATLALYQAKDAGAGQIRIYDPAIQDAIAQRLTLEKEIRQGLLQREFVIYYQPQLNSAGTTIGVEALVRWQHPQRGLVYPGEFLAAAEAAGLMYELDTQVLTGACTQLALWSGEPALSELEISVNISAFQMGRSEFASEVMAILASTGAEANRLKLELTETSLVNDMSLATQHMVTLRQKGVLFALDDFGTGYSSMSYLQRLPLDQLKIDQSFVKGLPSDKGSLAIVRAILALAVNFDFDVLAEGVETQAQCDLLEAEGCHHFQGYLFSRAIPAAQLERSLRESVVGDVPASDQAKPIVHRPELA